MRFDLRTLLALAILFVAIKGNITNIIPLGPSGPQTVFVAFEEDSKYMTTEFADLRADLQAGEAGKPFLDKGHRFLFIDNDTENPIVKKFAPYDDAKPEVIVYSGDKLKARFETSYKATAEELATALHGKGL